MVGVVSGATAAYFSDTETSTGNTFAAGNLDLTVDDNNGTNTVKFTVSNMRPGSQNIGVYSLKNVGTVNGYIDLENITITSHENDCLEPEVEASDASCGNPGDGNGELQNLVSLKDLFWDADCDGWYDAGDVVIFGGKVNAVASSEDTNGALNAGATQCLAAQFNGWNNTNDNVGMSDSFDFDATIELGQSTTQ